MLNPELVRSTIKRIRVETNAPIIMYTAWREEPKALADILEELDGITLTLHTRKDTEPYERLTQIVNPDGKMLRLNVFYGVSTREANTNGWKVKKDIRWIKDCPLPENEVFMRL